MPDKKNLLQLFLSSLLFAVWVPAAQADHAWGNYHWARTANPFALNLGNNLSRTWSAYLDTAAVKWDISQVLDPVVVPGATDPRRCRPAAGRVEVCNYKYGYTGWLGVAQIWTDGDHITHATTKLNDSYFNQAAYNTWAWRQFVACQEIGHTFGLDHQDETFSNLNLGSCMDYTSLPGGDGQDNPSNVYPNGHDYEELEIIYGHLDSTSTVTATALAEALPEMDVSGPAQWGKLIRSTHGGRTELYELDLGQRLGRPLKVFTFVIWTDSPRGNAERDLPDAAQPR